jgi:hypothetical protein
MARYSSDAEGSAMFGVSLEMGTVDLEGHVFIVHAEDGSRVGCGILSMVDNQLEADLESLCDSLLCHGKCDCSTRCRYWLDLLHGIRHEFGNPISLPSICRLWQGLTVLPRMDDAEPIFMLEPALNPPKLKWATTTLVTDSNPWAIVGYEPTSAAPVVGQH